MKFRERMQLVWLLLTHDFSSLEAKIQSLFATGGVVAVGWGRSMAFANKPTFF